jgi:hypothetical protein
LRSILRGVNALYWLARAAYDFMQSGPTSVATLPYLMAAAIPVTLVHELGHAIMARRRLDGDVAVSIGTAGRIAELRLAQVTISINALSDPTRPGGAAEFDAGEATARDVVAIALAGPLASLLGTIVCGRLLSSMPAGAPHHIVWAMTLGGVFGFALNLVPMTLEDRRGGRPLRSDGRLALDAWRVLRITRA